MLPMTCLVRAMPPKARTGSLSRQEDHPCNLAGERLSSLSQRHRTRFFCKTALSPLDSSNNGSPWTPFPPLFPFLNHSTLTTIQSLQQTQLLKSIPQVSPCLLVCSHAFIDSSPNKHLRSLCNEPDAMLGTGYTTVGKINKGKSRCVLMSVS